MIWSTVAECGGITVNGSDMMQIQLMIVPVLERLMTVKSQASSRAWTMLERTLNIVIKTENFCTEVFPERPQLSLWMPYSAKKCLPAIFQRCTHKDYTQIMHVYPLLVMK